jgi:hypothetical protein
LEKGQVQTIALPAISESSFDFSYKLEFISGPSYVTFSRNKLYVSSESSQETSNEVEIILNLNLEADNSGSSVGGYFGVDLEGAVKKFN